MLQPLQLEELSARHPEEVAELRHFLAKAGVPLDSANTLPTITARLHQDRTFRRDLTSHVLVLSHTDSRPLGYPGLLGILALAAAGPHFAAAASDTDAHDLLRFLMEARRSFDTSPTTHGASPVPAPVIVPFPSMATATEAAEIDEQPLLTRNIPPPTFAAPQSIAEETNHEPYQKTAIWVGVATCLLAVLTTGLWLHRSSPSNPGNPPAPISQGTEAASPTGALAQNEAEQPTLREDASHTTAPQPRNPPHAKPAAGTPLDTTPPPPAYVSTHNRPSPPAHYATPSRNNVVANTAAPRLPRRQPQPSSASSRAASSLIPKVQPVDLGDNAGPTYGTSATRAATVRPTSLGIMAANVTYSPAPSYPPAASAAHVQGEVKLEAEVGPDGNVTSARVISGPPLLREAAANALEHWHYRPYIADGKPIAMSALVVMDFQLP